MKRIYLLLLLILLSAGSASAQYVYNIQVRDNDGNTIANPNSAYSYLTGIRTGRTNSSTYSVRLGNSRTATDSGSGDNRVRTSAEWVFEPVEYTEGGVAEPGWYHIRNAGAQMAGYYLRATSSGAPEFSEDNDGDEAKWRLIKVVKADVPDRADNMYFKLVSKLDSDSDTGGGNLLYRYGTSTTNNIRTSTTYETGNSVFLLSVVGTPIVKNDDQEIVANEDPVSATDATNVVWKNLPPTLTMDATQNTKGGHMRAPNDLYYFSPIAYGGAANAQVMYGHYAAGNTEGDGYYFARLPLNDTYYQNISSTGNINSRIIFTVWLRAITGGTIEATEETKDEDPDSRLYSVGKAILSYTSGLAKEIDLTVPDWAIADPEELPNDPDAWYFFSYVISANDNGDDMGHGGRSISKIEIKNTIESDGDDAPLLDSDNIVVEVRSLTPEATFNYKHSGSPLQSRQNVHELHQTIYTMEGQTENLTTSTKNFAYYRWYQMTTSKQEVYPDRLAATATSGSTQAIMSNGVMYFNTNKTAIERGYQANLVMQEENFNTTDGSTIYCDLSNYTDFNLTGNLGSNGVIDEPSLSLRNVFHIRHASEIANAIDDSISAKTTYEYYQVESPTGIRLRLTPQYNVANYWVNVSGGPTKATRFLWRRFTPAELRTNPNYLYTVGSGTNIATTSTGTFSFANGSSNAYKYLQVDSYSTTDTIYFAVDLATGSGNNYTARKRVAIFQVVYKDKDKVGPIARTEAQIAVEANDIFASIPDKKLIISRTFDQMDDPQNPLPGPFPPRDIEGRYSNRGMGVQPLAVDESSYGFVNPLHYSGTGTNTGTHLHHRAPYWSEYGFPQQINGVTNGYSWSNNGSTIVSDITYLKAGKTVGSMGNMLYVDASELPGVFAALNFNESFCAGTRLYCSAWVVNLNSGSAGGGTGETAGTRPNLVMVLKATKKGGAETIVKRFYTGDIGYGEANTWFQVGFEFVIPQELNNEEVDFRLEIQNNGLSTTGNDFALDDICVYRTNPAISAVRTNEIFCMPDAGEVGVKEPLEMEVQVNLTQLWGDKIKDYQYLFFRFLDADVQAFPLYQNGTTGDPMYVNNDEYTNGNVKYAYGKVDVKSFDVPVEGKDNVFISNLAGTNPLYKGMYTYKEGDDLILVFQQLIPTYVLNANENGTDFNTGTYHVYVAETDANLLTPTCAGAGDFKIQFDATDFEMTVGGTALGETGDLAICTNNDVDVKAYATAPNTEERLFAYYDWYLGPLNTQPYIFKTENEPDTIYNARDFVYDLIGQYEDGALVFGTIKTAPIRNRDGFDVWLDTIQGRAWKLDEETNGPEWVWGEPNYVGFNQYGGYFRYYIPGFSVDTEVAGDDPEPFAVDAITSATRIGARDNKDTSGEEEKKPVDFRTLKKDLAAYRFFFPYEDSVPNANLLDPLLDKFPVDYRKLHSQSSDEDHHYLKYIDFNTGVYYADEAHTTVIDDGYTGVDALRFTETSYYTGNENVEYMTNYVGEYIKADGSIATTDEERVPYIKDLRDLNNLLARMHYWEYRGYVKLYKDRIDVSITSLANNYLTVVPSNVAFFVDDINQDKLSLNDMKTVLAICTTPAPITLKAESWSPDSWLGQVNPKGVPDMPYFDIDDSTYIYTVRLPERQKITMPNKQKKEIKPTSQFVFPMLYFDEITHARVKIVDVINETGASVVGDKKNLVLQEAYIGLIDTVYTNKLDPNVWIPFTHKYIVGTEDSEELDEVKQVNARWKLIADRSDSCAFESYPLVHNGYNYFFEDPVDNEVSQEGDPLPIGSIINEDTDHEFVVDNNRIGIEVMANDAYLRDFVDPVNLGDGTFEYHFRPGYIYEFVMEATGGDWADEGKCDLSVDFRLKVVPDTVIWKGNITSDDFDHEEWNLDGYNWYIPTKKNDKYSDVPSAYTTFPPLPDTKVIISTGATSYATLEQYENLVAVFLVNRDEKDSTGYDTSKKIIAMELVSPQHEPQAYAQKKDYLIHTTPFIEFDYNYVPNACDTIHFKTGAVLGRQDQLNYTYAKVDLNLETNRWYGLSAPLRNMYSGDFMFERHNPLVEMRVHNTTSPQSGALFADWTQPFHNVNEELTAGRGFSSRIGKIKYTDAAFNTTNKGFGIVNYNNYDELTDATFYFPGKKMSFDFYDEISKTLSMKDYQTILPGGRAYGHRFVYEIGDEESVVPKGDVLVELPVSISDPETERAMLVGNPFMGHIDFGAFFKENIAIIEPEYKILSGGNQYVSLSGDAQPDSTIINIISSDQENKLTLKSIPPMQSFMVKIKEGIEAGSKLRITKKMSVVDPEGSKLRSSSGQTLSNPGLTISASTADHSSQAVVVLSETAENNYRSHEDSRVMLIKGVNEVPKVFTEASGMYLDINRMQAMPQELPIGLITGSKLKTTLTISGFRSLQDYDEFYFKDKQKNILTRISGNTYEYTFDNKEGDQLGRFSIICTNGVTELEVIDNSSIFIYMSQGNIYISTLDGSELKDVTIVRATGEIIHRQSNTGKSQLKIPVSIYSQEVLFIKAGTEKESVTTKVLDN